MIKGRFSPWRHVPEYTRALLSSLQSPPLVFFALVGNLVLITCIGIFHHFESPLNSSIDSFFDSLWWGMATVTTVGYGDIVPVTLIGKCIAMVLMVLGVCFFVGFTGLFVTAFVSVSETDLDRGYEKILKKLAEIESRLPKS